MFFYKILSLLIICFKKLGISGNLINSNVLSRNNNGCAGYMAPERIDPGKVCFIIWLWA